MQQTFAIVGPGRVGQALARQLTRIGLQLVGILGRDERHSHRAAEKLRSLSVSPLTTQWTDMAEKADVIFVTTQDTVVQAVAEDLATRLGGWAGRERNGRNRIVLHTSGALSSEVLSPFRAHGFQVGSFHPMQAVTGGDSGLLREIAWGIEGDPAAVHLATDLALALNGTPLPIQQDTKPLYHAAACVVSNYLMVLLQVGAKLLISSGVEEEDAVQALLPLMAGALTNAKQEGVPDALTGPIERGDVSTVQEHLAAFQVHDIESNVSHLYRLLGHAAVQMAISKGSISDKQADAIRSILYERDSDDSDRI